SDSDEKYGDPLHEASAQGSLPDYFRRRICLDDFDDELLARLAGLRVVGAVVGDVVGHDTDADEWNPERPGDLGRRRRLHLLDRRAEALVKQVNAIELAVPDFARSNDAFDDPALPIRAARAARRVEPRRIATQPSHRARIRILSPAAIRPVQVEWTPLRHVAAAAPRAKSRLERSEIDGLDAEDDVEDVDVGLVAARGALIHDGRRTVSFGGQGGGRGCVLHALQRLRDHDGIAVNRADPESKLADALFARVGEGGRQSADLDVHRALNDDRPLLDFACRARRKHRGAGHGSQYSPRLACRVHPWRLS